MRTIGLSLLLALVGCGGFQPITVSADLGVGDLSAPDANIGDLANADGDASDLAHDLAMFDLAHTLVWDDLTPSVSVGAIYGLWGRSSTQVYGVGNGGMIVRTDDGGQNWGTLSSGVTIELRGVWGDSNATWIVGESLTILKSTDGTNFSPQTMNIAQDLGVAPQLFAIWGTGADLFAVGDTGVILHSDDAGATWNTQYRATGFDFRGVWGTGPNNMFVVGYEISSFDVPAIFHTDNGGTTWTRQTTPSALNKRLYAVWGKDALDVYAVGGGPGTAHYLHTSNGGATWDEVANAGSASFNAVWGGPGGAVHAVNGDGEVLSTINSGQSFDTQVLASGAALYAMWGSAADNVYVAGYEFGPSGGTVIFRFH